LHRRNGSLLRILYLFCLPQRGLHYYTERYCIRTTIFNGVRLSVMARDGALKDVCMGHLNDVNATGSYLNDLHVYFMLII
jgi:hypothetical protein